MSTATTPAFRLAVLGLVAALAGACSSTSDTSPAERRAYEQLATQRTLADLENARPGITPMLEHAPGYAVFQTRSAQIFEAGEGIGFGVLHDNAGGRDTFMRVADLDTRRGKDPREFRAVFVFTDAKTLERCAAGGWEIGDALFLPGIDVYQLDGDELVVPPDLARTRYFRDGPANRGR